jgi:hypothetical protein
MKRVKYIAVLVALAGGFTVMRFINPENAALYPHCPLHAATGIECPACGSSRAAFDLAHFDLASAWAHNPLAVLAVPFLLVFAFGGWVGAWDRMRFKFIPPAIRHNLIWIVAALLLLFTVWRNIAGIS